MLVCRNPRPHILFLCTSILLLHLIFITLLFIMSLFFPCLHSLPHTRVIFVLFYLCYFSIFRRVFSFSSFSYVSASICPSFSLCPSLVFPVLSSFNISSSSTYKIVFAQSDKLRTNFSNLLPPSSEKKSDSLKMEAVDFPKLWYISVRVHGVESQRRTVMFIFTAV
jgi:cytochrome c oxidase assembly factor CtaG